MDNTKLEVSDSITTGVARATVKKKQPSLRDFKRAARFEKGLRKAILRDRRIKQRSAVATEPQKRVIKTLKGLQILPAKPKSRGKYIPAGVDRNVNCKYTYYGEAA